MAREDPECAFAHHVLGYVALEEGSSAALEVDGGVTRDTIHSIWEAGADTFVAGNAIFSAQNRADEIAAMRGRCGVFV